MRFDRGKGEFMVQRMQGLADIGARGNRIVEKQNRIGDSPQIGLRAPLLLGHVKSRLHLEGMAHRSYPPLFDLLPGDDMGHGRRLPRAFLASRGDGKDIQILAHEHQQRVVPSGGRPLLSARSSPDGARKSRMTRAVISYVEKFMHHNLSRIPSVEDDRRRIAWVSRPSSPDSTEP